MLESLVIIDGRDHLLGRLASIVAKELLSGQKIVLVRCDEVVMSGSLVRNSTKYAQFKTKRMNTNPTKGPYHYRSPARIVWRVIRGMINHTSPRGAEALGRLSTFEGIPAPYDKKKRVVVPSALRTMQLKSGRRYTVLADLSHAYGWKHKELLKKLEDKRKVEAEAFYQKKKAQLALKRQAITEAAGELSEVQTELAAHGY